MHSDYFGSNHTQETDHTFVNTVNTNRSTRKGKNIYILYLCLHITTKLQNIV